MAAGDSTLALEIVTPQGVVLDERVEEVVAPSVHGEFGVLPGHLPMLAALQVGLLHYTKGGKVHDVAVGKGFAEVLRDRTIILTDRYILRDEIDVLSVRERLEEVDAILEKWTGDRHDPERLELIEEEQWLAAQLELYGDPPPARVLEDIPAADYGNIIPDYHAEGESQLKGNLPAKED
jgi:F-type H+-transporting ATPase subunit epsilon